MTELTEAGESGQNISRHDFKTLAKRIRTEGKEPETYGDYS